MRTVCFGPPAAALEERELVITRIFDAPRESRSPNQLRSKGMGMTAVQKITPCLWFDNQAEDAAKFYVSIFENSAIGAITRYGKEGFEVHGRPEGSAMTVSFRLEGQEFTALKRTAFQVHRGDFLCGEMRDSGRSRSLLGQADRRR